MTRLQVVLATGGLALALLALLLPYAEAGAEGPGAPPHLALAGAVAAGLLALSRSPSDPFGHMATPARLAAALTLFLGTGLAMAAMLGDANGPLGGAAAGGFWAALGASWLLSWCAVELLAALRPRHGLLRRVQGGAVALAFGAVLLAAWEAIVRGAGVPLVILPAPSDIGAALVSEAATLRADFVQTVLRSVLPGYVIGCGAAFATALAIDRSPFLQRGLLPVGTLASALPIVGIAPIMVMWFGFDWQSKAAVVVVMCFFPMLVNTMQGLAAADRLQGELMRTYAASYRQTLLKLRLPAAAPAIFNGLKICTTLALIGAIVAEFFGTPITGIGFRISTEIGRLALDKVWAGIAVAALSGSVFFGLVALAERAVTFWHPSIRSRA